jgi:hypothetical protein
VYIGYCGADQRHTHPSHPVIAGLCVRIPSRPVIRVSRPSGSGGSAFPKFRPGRPHFCDGRAQRDGTLSRLTRQSSRSQLPAMRPRAGAERRLVHGDASVQMRWVRTPDIDNLQGQNRAVRQARKFGKPKGLTGRRLRKTTRPPAQYPAAKLAFLSPEGTGLTRSMRRLAWA